MKRLLSLIIIILLCVPMFSTVIPRGEAQGGLVGYWSFDEGSGTIAYDSSGNSNHGTLNNGPVWVDGRFGKALSFDGVDDYVRIEPSSSLDVTSQITVEAWVYPRAYVDSNGDNSHIISRCALNGGHIYVLQMYSPTSAKAGYSVNPNPPHHASSADLPLNTWTHLAMTYDGATVKLYINGEFDSSYAQSGLIETTSNWLAFGCKPTGPQGGSGTYAYLNGIIDEVRIYNRALSQQEIQTDMGGLPSPPQTGSISGVVFYLDSEGNVVTIPGATVSLTYTSYTTTTDDYGRYILTNIPFDRWMMSCNVAGYPERNEYAIINYTHPDATVHFCMKAQIMDDLKEKAISALNNIEGWLQTEAQHIDNFAAQHQLHVGQSLLEEGISLVLCGMRWSEGLPLPEAAKAVVDAIVSEYVSKNLASSMTIPLADIINQYHLSEIYGLHVVRYENWFSTARQQIEQSFSPLHSAALFKYPRPIDPELRAYIRDMSDHFERIATMYEWGCELIDDTIDVLTGTMDVAWDFFEIGTALAAAGVAAIPISIWVGGTVAAVGAITATASMTIVAGEFSLGYSKFLIPSYIRFAEEAASNLEHLKYSLSDAFTKASNKNMDPSIRIPGIQIISGETPSFSIKNPSDDDVSVDTVCIAQLAFPELVGEVTTPYFFYTYKEQTFSLSPGAEKSFTIYYPVGVVSWIDDVRTKITSPTELLIELTVYADYGASNLAKCTARKQTMIWSVQEYPTNYNEFVLYSSCDLHIYDSNGRHTGLNYTTNGIDCQIPNSLYYANDVQRILILEPSGRYVVRLIGTNNGEYHLQIRSVFATVVVSEQWINGTIIDGQIMDYHIYVGSTGVPIVDEIPPTTKIEFGESSLEAPERVFLTRSTPISLLANDNAGGSGVSLTTYRIYNNTCDSGWLIYNGQFNLSLYTEGNYTVAFYSTDNAGNIEPTNIIQVTLFSWTYIFTDSYGRGTTLKINTQYKLFQFTAPNKDFGIKHDIKMVQLKNVIIICYEDREMRLIATAVDDRIDFCSAIAWDKTSNKKYLLIDKPNCRTS
jgi:hypothetical protein